MTKHLCADKDCVNPISSRGLCKIHYLRHRRAGTLSKFPKINRKKNRICSIGQCQNKHHAKGFCAPHFRRNEMHGSPHISINARKGEALNWLKDFLSSDIPDTCVDWPYSKKPDGYGVVWYNDRTVGAHGLSLTLSGVPKPANKDVCAHAPVICHNRLCVNPKHLRWATFKENAEDIAIDARGYI